MKSVVRNKLSRRIFGQRKCAVLRKLALLILFVFKHYQLNFVCKSRLSTNFALRKSVSGSILNHD